MYKDIPRSELLKSPLSKKFLKFYSHGQTFISYKSNFILDGFLFFPIDENTFTCRDLFCHFENVTNLNVCFLKSLNDDHSHTTDCDTATVQQQEIQHMDGLDHTSANQDEPYKDGSSILSK